MKKQILLSMSVCAIIAGCAHSVDVASAYQSELNSDIKSLSSDLQAMLGDGAKLDIADFGCKYHSGHISCVSSGATLSLNGELVASTGEIYTDSTEIYDGSQSGKISLSKAYENIAKKGFGDELKIHDIKLSELGYELVLEMFGVDIHDPSFDIRAAQEYKLANDKLAGDLVLELEGSQLRANAGIKALVDYKSITKLIDESKIAYYDTNSQIIITNDDVIESMDAKDIEALEDSMLKGFVVYDIDAVISSNDKEFLHQDAQELAHTFGFIDKMPQNKLISKDDKELARMGLKAIANYQSTMPRKINAKISSKNGFDLYHIFVDGSDFVPSSGDAFIINGFDFTKFMMKR